MYPATPKQPASVPADLGLSLLEGQFWQSVPTSDARIVLNVPVLHPTHALTKDEPLFGLNVPRAQSVQAAGEVAVVLYFPFWQMTTESALPVNPALSVMEPVIEPVSEFAGQSIH